MIYFNFSPATRRAFRGDSLRSCELLPSYFLARIDLRPGFRSIAATLSSLQVGEQVYRELKGLSMYGRVYNFFFSRAANFPRLTHRTTRRYSLERVFLSESRLNVNFNNEICVFFKKKQLFYYILNAEESFKSFRYFSQQM